MQSNVMPIEATMPISSFDDVSNIDVQPEIELPPTDVPVVEIEQMKTTVPLSVLILNELGELKTLVETTANQQNERITKSEQKVDEVKAVTAELQKENQALKEKNRRYEEHRGSHTLAEHYHMVNKAINKRVRQDHKAQQQRSSGTRLSQLSETDEASDYPNDVYPPIPDSNRSSTSSMDNANDVYDDLLIAAKSLSEQYAALTMPQPDVEEVGTEPCSRRTGSLSYFMRKLSADKSEDEDGSLSSPLTHLAISQHTEPTSNIRRNRRDSNHDKKNPNYRPHF